METIFFFLCLPIAYLIFLAATIDLFYRKGLSSILGLVVGIFLPVIGLLAALVMPYDQSELEERKQRALIDQQRDRDRFFKFQQEYNARHAAPQPPPLPLEPDNEPTALARTQTVCGVILIASLLLTVAPLPPAYIGVLGILAVLSLLGLTVAILIPVGQQR